MADTLSERLRELERACLEQDDWGNRGWLERAEACREAAAELDRREAIVAAAEAWAKVEREHRRVLQPDQEWTIYHRETVDAATAILALLPEAD